MLAEIGEGFAFFVSFSLGGRGDGEKRIRVSIGLRVKG